MLYLSPASRLANTAACNGSSFRRNSAIGNGFWSKNDARTSPPTTGAGVTVRTYHGPPPRAALCPPLIKAPCLKCVVKVQQPATAAFQRTGQAG